MGGRSIILYIALAIFLILALISFRINKQAVNVRKQEKLRELETMTTGLPAWGKNITV
jgi:hypothetical protein